MGTVAARPPPVVSISVTDPKCRIVVLDLAEKLFQKAYSTPAPSSQPARSKVPLPKPPTPSVMSNLSRVQAAPPLP